MSGEDKAREYRKQYLDLKKSGTASGTTVTKMGRAHKETWYANWNKTGASPATSLREKMDGPISFSKPTDEFRLRQMNTVDSRQYGGHAVKANEGRPVPMPMTTAKHQSQEPVQTGPRGGKFITGPGGSKQYVKGK